MNVLKLFVDNVKINHKKINIKLATNDINYYKLLIIQKKTP